MAQMTRRHRAIVERRLGRIRQREGRTIMAQRRHTGITKHEFHEVLEKASQPIEHESKSDQEQS